MLYNCPEKMKNICKYYDETMEGNCTRGESSEYVEKCEQKRNNKEGKMEEIKTESQQVAREILNQLGGNRFIAMTGAKNWYATGNSISFKIGKNSKGISWVLITLNAMDTYDISFNNFQGKPKSTAEDIYADQLQETFTQHTGLYTNL